MIEWQWRTFDALSNAELYTVLAARSQVFVIEQTCIFPDMDGLDASARHLLGWTIVAGQRRLAAYLRVLAPGVKYTEASIGRVLTTPAARGTGAGRALLVEGTLGADRLYPGHANRIGAQLYLEKFYQQFGYVTITAPYEEDGIMHVDMLRAAR
ncbi:MAG: GNAT family N-acetyltransferase [Pseudomonadota bacterium]|nr:GNAT family N-acetyltransferase [Pseudomonadota bacterium]